MVFSRTIARVACGAIAMLVAPVYCLVLAVSSRVLCDGPASSPYIGANLFAAVLLPLLALSLLADPWRRGLRWLTLPLILLVPLAVHAVWPYLDAEALSRIAACEAPPGSARFWHAWWAPVHLTVLALVSLASARLWRSLGPTAAP